MFAWSREIVSLDLAYLLKRGEMTMKKTLVTTMAAFAACATIGGADAVELSIWSWDQSEAYKAVSGA